MVNLILGWGLILLASLGILIKSSDYLIDGISSYARKLGLSTYLIGLLVVSIAASAPEFIASLTGGSLGSSEVAFGALVGTNIAHIFFVFGTLAIFGRRMNIECRILHKTKVFIFIFAMLPFVLLWDGMLSRSDGALLLFVFFIYFGILWRKEGRFGKIKKNVHLKHIWRDATLFLLALVALFMSAFLLVHSSVNLASLFRLSPLFISLTVIAIGDALSDMVVGVQAIRKKQATLGVGDILGSTMTNFLLGLGLVALIYPIKIAFNSVISVVAFAVAGMVILLLYIRHGEIGWKGGVVLVLGYIAFIIIQAAVTAYV